MEITRKPDEAKGFKKIAETMTALAAEKQPAPEPEPEPKPEDPLAPEDPMEEKVAAIKADEAVLKFTEGLKNRKQRQRPAPAGSYDAAAEKIFELVYSIDPTLAERDQMCASEWGLSACQRIVKYALFVLDQGYHLNVVQGYDFLEPGMAPNLQNPTQISSMKGKCPQCEKEFDRQVPGQICCSNECGFKYFPKPEQKQPQFDQAFNDFIESQLNKPQPFADPVHADRGIPASGVLR